MIHSVRHSRIPYAEILTRKGLSDRAKLVYSLMAAWVFEGRVAKIGTRMIGEELRFSAMTVSRKLAELEGLGLISKSPTARGARGYYVLNSELYAQKQGRETVIRSSPDGTRKRMVSVDLEREKTG